MTLATRPDYTAEQIDLIKSTVAAGTTDLELALFLEVAKSTGLNPFQKQIYAIKRGQGDRAKMTIQTGIDGYRLIASRTGTHLGTTDPEFGPLKDGYPEWARVIVRRLVHGHVAEFPATARWSEYVQTKDEWRGGQRTGNVTVSEMWAKMPHTMLGKCAESLALRKAFPAELSGVYTSEEMQQADVPAPAAQERQEDPREVAARQRVEDMAERVLKIAPEPEVTATMREWRHGVMTTIETYENLKALGLKYAPKKDPAPASEVRSDTPEVLATAEQVKVLAAHTRTAGCTTSEDRATLYAYLKPDVQGSTKELTTEQAAFLIDTLSGMAPDERQQAFTEAKKAAKGVLL